MMLKDRSIGLVSAAAAFALLAGGHFVFAANTDKTLTALEQVRENCEQEKEQTWFHRLMKGNYHTSSEDGSFVLNGSADCDAVVSEINHVEQTLSDQKSEIVTLKQAEALAVRDKDKLSKQIAVLKGRHDESIDAIQLKDLELKGISDATARLQAELAKAEEERLASSKKADDFSARNLELSNEITSLKTKLLEEREEVQRLAFELENNSSDKAVKQVLSALKEKLSETEAQLAELKSDLAKRLTAEELLKTANFDKLEVAELSDAATKLQLELAAAEEKLAADQKTIVRLGEYKAEAEVEISALSDRLSQAEDQVKTLTAALTDSRSNTNMETLQTELSMTKAKLAETQRELGSFEIKLAATQSLLSKARTTTVADGAVDAGNSGLISDNKVDADLAELQALNSKLSQQLQSLEGTIAGLKSEEGVPAEDLKDLVAEIKKDVSSVTSHDGRLVLNNGILFYPASAFVSKKGKVALREIAEHIKAKLDENHNWSLFVEGHTDQQSISTSRYPSNWHLGGARAANVVRILIKEGVPAERLFAASLAALRPIDDRATKEAYAKNRRVELRFTKL